jgi:3-isopropylmalate/(R)-2-methylmalate dehydratase large subunit
MSERLTVCNMSIEMGARAGMISPDEVTLAYIAKGERPFAPKGKAFDALVEQCRGLATDDPALYDRQVSIDASTLKPQVTWGTTPAMTIDVDGLIPPPKDAGEERAQMYMGVKPGQAIQDLTVNTVFIGSCTNGRLGDLREAAAVLKGRKVAAGVRAFVVPGSEGVKRQAEEEGLDKVFKDAGFEWHFSGCSMCLGMNGDILRPQERSASTSNRPYEGRQGPGSRTHLVSPATAAATAVKGRFTDPREMV